MVNKNKKEVTSEFFGVPFFPLAEVGMESYESGWLSDVQERHPGQYCAWAWKEIFSLAHRPGYGRGKEKEIMNIIEKYNKRAQKINSLLCVGLDADFAKIPKRFLKKKFSAIWI